MDLKSRMKKLVVIVGANGVGKSTTAKELVARCERMAYVDSDWCRVMNPFAFTEITKQTVTENIYCLIHNYLCCEEIDTVVFTYSWHGLRKKIYDNIIDKLKNDGILFQEHVIILRCAEEENIRRAIEDGRDNERVKRGMEHTYHFYDDYDYPVIDTTELMPKEVAEKIIEMIQSESMQLVEDGVGKFSVLINQQIFGSIETYENEFHKGNCYMKFEFEEYDLSLASEIFALLQNRMKRPLQVMLSSSEVEKIAFLEKAGFVCKRKCYEACVTMDDLCDMGNVVHIENGNTFMCCGRGSEEYDMCTRFLYEYYRNVHEAVNPLTASYEEFLKPLPDEVYYDSYEGEVRHIAFVEENEIAYVGSRDKSDFGRFITGVVRNLFNLYEELTFEYDDCDETAIVLKDLFEAEVEESYNTYVREWDI